VSLTYQLKNRVTFDKEEASTLTPYTRNLLNIIIKIGNSNARTGREAGQ